jgi:hypothetical protein
MDSWSTASKVGLAIAACAMFAAVFVLDGRETRSPLASVPPADIAADAAPGSTPRRIGMAAAKQPDVPSPGSMNVESPAREPSPDAGAEVQPELPDVGALSRQVMPVDETTAEENEQRGDAIRQLGSNPSADSTSALIYALRNDVDVRNRILAIDGLRRAALAGSTDRAIPDALVDASRSGDEVIASQASQALAEIERASSRR